jgi:hypothetical protein
MVLNGLNSRALLLILGIMGMFYGITGVAQLGVSIDGVLLLGAVMIVIVAFLGKYSTPAEAVVK